MENPTILFSEQDRLSKLDRLNQLEIEVSQAKKELRDAQIESEKQAQLESTAWGRFKLGFKDGSWIKAQAHQVQAVRLAREKYNKILLQIKELGEEVGKVETPQLVLQKFLKNLDEVDQEQNEQAERIGVSRTVPLIDAAIKREPAVKVALTSQEEPVSTGNELHADSREKSHNGFKTYLSRIITGAALFGASVAGISYVVKNSDKPSPKSSTEQSGAPGVTLDSAAFNQRNNPALTDKLGEPGVRSRVIQGGETIYGIARQMIPGKEFEQVWGNSDVYQYNDIQPGGTLEYSNGKFTYIPSPLDRTPSYSTPQSVLPKAAEALSTPASISPSNSDSLNAYKYKAEDFSYRSPEVNELTPKDSPDLPISNQILRVPGEPLVAVPDYQPPAQSLDVSNLRPPIVNQAPNDSLDTQTFQTSTLAPADTADVRASADTLTTQGRDFVGQVTASNESKSLTERQGMSAAGGVYPEIFKTDSTEATPDSATAANHSRTLENPLAASEYIEGSAAQSDSSAADSLSSTGIPNPLSEDVGSKPDSIKISTPTNPSLYSAERQAETPQPKAQTLDQALGGQVTPPETGINGSVRISEEGRIENMAPPSILQSTPSSAPSALDTLSQEAKNFLQERSVSDLINNWLYVYADGSRGFQDSRTGKVFKFSFDERGRMLVAKFDEQSKRYIDVPLATEERGAFESSLRGMSGVISDENRARALQSPFAETYRLTPSFEGFSDELGNSYKMTVYGDFIRNTADGKTLLYRNYDPDSQPIILSEQLQVALRSGFPVAGLNSFAELNELLDKAPRFTIPQ